MKQMDQIPPPIPEQHLPDQLKAEINANEFLNHQQSCSSFGILDPRVELEERLHTLLAKERENVLAYYLI